MFGKSLPRRTPESQGISSTTVADFADSLNQEIQHIHSFMLMRHGFVVAEAWWRPYRPEAPHMLFSLSKSFTSTAVGLAVAEGRLSVEDKILSFFPEDAPKKISRNLADMKVKHLLSMSTGHEQDSTESTMRSRNPYKGFLSMPVKHVPGTYFVYNSGASYMLSALVQKITGETLLDYLTPRILEPLGIVGATWDSHPNGVNFGGWGLNIKTEDIARFGQLYLQKGLWNGKRILTEEWVAAATSSQVQNDLPDIDWKQGYGYQFWRCQHNNYRGDGAFGQFCIVMPNQDAVLAITAGVPNMQAVLTIVWDKLFPAMEKTSLPGAEMTSKKLANRLMKLDIPASKGAIAFPVTAQITGKTYHFESKNPEKLKNIRFDFAETTGTFTYTLSGGKKRRGTHQVTFGYGKWHEGTMVLLGDKTQPVTASGVWTTPSTFELMVCWYETPFISTLCFQFDGEKVIYQFMNNVSFRPQTQQQVTGVLKPGS
jgi:CubicO group peptidase (beta-lactamase class C family)